MKFTFNKKAFLIFIILLLIEICIAVFVKDTFIRPFFGDVLVVILMYYLLKSFIKTHYLYILISVFLLSFGIEILQYFQLNELLGIQNKIIKIIIGSTFDYYDLLAYTLGIIVVYYYESKKSKNE